MTVVFSPFARALVDYFLGRLGDGVAEVGGSVIRGYIASPLLPLIEQVRGSIPLPGSI